MCVDNIKSPLCFPSWFLSSPACMRGCVCAFTQEVHSLYSPAVYFFLTSNARLCAACGSETDPIMAEGCPTRERPTVIISDKATVWVSQCVMKANLCTPGAGDLCHGCPWDDFYDEGASWLDDSVFYHRGAKQWGLAPSAEPLCESWLKCSAL